ncbi:MAG: type I DNA topoisomerase, partial [Lachnospiraceae bacterium]|nr:type I DNA topoisomerase [Lachnospiraceae bacterium]
MAKYLVIVESPAKAKTIKKFLGANYTVEASNGHVRDLPKSQLGFDPANGFEPKYITIRGKGDLLAHLRREGGKADKVFLATDPDREGEAISWHLAAALNLKDKKYSRITFNEITKTAVKGSIKQAREIDQNLVDAQQARRVLDRMVGYSISPLLWKKIKRGLSAGRVQSAALRIICDRENEISAFIPEEYWTIEARFTPEHGTRPIQVHYFGKNDQKAQITCKAEADALLKELENIDYKVREVKKAERMRQAPLPFTTSTLQQEAAKTLGFATQKTMRLAQQLYEGVDVKGHGTVGLITYLRTDSTRISDEAETAVRQFVQDNYGASSYSEGNKKGHSGGKVQDAHEAIRPTYVDLTPAAVKDSLSRDQFRLYQLIWKRFVGSRMSAAVYETMTVRMEGEG